MNHEGVRSNGNVGRPLVDRMRARGVGAGAGRRSRRPDGIAGLKLVEARDKNPDPKIVEIDLTARVAEVEVAPGKTVQAWTYDGGIPGPLIRAHVGDRVIVHFTNDLPQPTTVHWHGVRVPIEMDGVPDISQPEMKRGDTFTYDFVVRDAGLYWYHPHVMSAAQVGFGLYGALLVEDPADGVGVADQLTHRAERHRLRSQRRARVARQRRPGRDGVRPRGRLHPGQRQDHADAARALRRSAALAHRQRGQEPLLPPRSRRPAVLRHRRRRRPAGNAGDDGHAARHARRARGRHRDADRPEEAGRSRCGRCSTTAATAASNIATSRMC